MGFLDDVINMHTGILGDVAKKEIAADYIKNLGIGGNTRQWNTGRGQLGDSTDIPQGTSRISPDWTPSETSESVNPVTSPPPTSASVITPDTTQTPIADDNTSLQSLVTRGQAPSLTPNRPSFGSKVMTGLGRGLLEGLEAVKLGREGYAKKAMLEDVVYPHEKEMEQLGLAKSLRLKEPNILEQARQHFTEGTATEAEKRLLGQQPKEPTQLTAEQRVEEEAIIVGHHSDPAAFSGIASSLKDFDDNFLDNPKVLQSYTKEQLQRMRENIIRNWEIQVGKRPQLPPRIPVTQPTPE